MQPPSSRSSAPLLPWLLGLFLSPLLFGSVDPEGKIIVGILFSLSLLFLITQLRGAHPGQPTRGTILPWFTLLCLLLPLCPLPIAWIEAINPQRAALAQSFPVQAGSPAGWLPLTLSSTDTITRLADLALIIAAFQLARFTATRTKGRHLFILTLGFSLLALAGSDLWFRLDGRHRLLGIWPDSAGHAAGTFANRNHFANWIYLASLFAFGWILRQLSPLKSCRSPNAPKLTSSIPTLLLLSIAIVFSLIMAVQTASRGGMLAFLAGCLLWAALLRHRSQSRHRWRSVAAIAFLALCGLLVVSNPLLHRLASSGTDSAFKLAIWTDSLKLFTQFPLFGTGPGTFHTAFNHFKTFGGEQTFLHAENEFVQLLVEHGLIGASLIALLVGSLFLSTLRFAWRDKLSEPELIFGALAAFFAFLVHGVVEFVFQIPANAILAASFLGFVLGCRDHTVRPLVVPLPTNTRILFNLACGLALLSLAGVQSGALLRWRQGLNAPSPSAAASDFSQSLRLWPWDSSRQLALARSRFHSLSFPNPISDDQQIPPAIHQQLNRALALDPFNWELRLERAWLQLSFSTNQTPTTDLAWEVTRLNPLQPQIPLSFARHLVDRDPALALQFLKAAPLNSPDHLHQAFSLAWNLNQDTATLWALTPDTPAGLQALADFALKHNLAPMASLAQNRARQLPQ